jgi:hypothetical protein
MVPLKLGAGLEFGGSGVLRVPCLTDNAAIPVFDAQLKCFSNGFVLDRIDKISQIPVAISFERNVDKVWIVDIADVTAQALKLIGSNSTNGLPMINEDISGYAMIFHIKQQSIDGQTTLLNPFDRLFPALLTIDEPKSLEYFAMFILQNNNNNSNTSNSNSATTFPALDTWKTAFRVNDIDVSVGRKAVIPESILLSSIIAIDRLADNSNAIFSNPARFNEGEHIVSFETFTDIIQIQEDYMNNACVPGRALQSMM